MSFGRNQWGYKDGKVGQAELWLRFYSGGLWELLEDIAPGDVVAVVVVVVVVVVIIIIIGKRRRKRRNNLY